MVPVTTKRKSKSLLRLAAYIAAGVIGWDLLKAHTGVARPQGRGVNQ
ncbi:MAG: hypothetical protein JWM85_1122 [Acidimicrobiaceae bacterium]|nr:hypothetical protein [Acidimicrobiaceae bacterium]